jgi:drug/metabolite transporter (DMT)-like permease
MRFTSAANSGFITGLFVLFVPIMLHVVFRTPPRPLHWIAVAIAVGGLWALTGGLRTINRGDALTLVAAAAYAAHLLALDRAVKGADVLLLTFHQFWMTGATCTLLSIAAGLPLGVSDARTAGIIVFLALVPTLSGFFVQAHAQRHTPPLKVSLIFSTEPVFAALFAWTLGGETFRASSAVGGALIVCGMVIAELARDAPRRESAG